MAGFGAQTLFSGDARSQDSLARLNRILQWLVIVLVAGLGIPAMLEKPDVSEWYYVSLFFAISSWTVYFYIIRGHRTNFTRFLLFAVIVCDLNVFNWTILSKKAYQKQGKDYLEQMMSMRPVVDFLKSQDGLFRVDLEGEGGDYPASMGNIFGVKTTSGYGATMLDDYLPVRSSPNGPCLLNVRYIVGNRKDRQGVPVFAAGPWKVYEKPSYCPRAWVVHNVVVEPSHERLIKRIQAGGFDPLQVAFLSERLEVDLDAQTACASQVSFGHYQEDGLELMVDAQGIGMLVLSEIYYPGWEATINGKAVHIYKVDGILRGMIVSRGENRIVLRYRPLTVLAGGILTVVAFSGTLFLAVLVLRREKTLKNF